jgi:hypothetical protein
MRELIEKIKIDIALFLSLDHDSRLPPDTMLTKLSKREELGSTWPFGARRKLRSRKLQAPRRRSSRSTEKAGF